MGSDSEQLVNSLNDSREQVCLFYECIPIAVCDLYFFCLCIIFRKWQPRLPPLAPPTLSLRHRILPMPPLPLPPPANMITTPPTAKQQGQQQTVGVEKTLRVPTLSPVDTK